MRREVVILGAITAVLSPIALNEYILSDCPEVSKNVVKDSPAYAMPSFSRQTGLSCNTCHTIPPRLNAYGRLFKMRGYTDGKAIGEIMTGDGASIWKYNPISIRLLSFPYSKKKGEDREVLFPDEVVIAFAGKVSENVGAFAALASEEGHPIEPEIVKAVFVKDLGNLLVGVVGGKTSPTGTDPFESLNLYSRITRSKTPVWSYLGDGIADIWNLKNYGASVYLYFNNLIYANVGAYTGIVKQNGNVKNKAAADPIDFYGRVALTPTFGAASINLGAFYYAGKDSPDAGDVNNFGGNTSLKPNRLGLDIGILYTMGDFGFELNGIYVNGKDKFSNNPDFKHDGYNLSLNLYWKGKIAVSLLHGQYKYKSDNPLTPANDTGIRMKDTTLHLSYMLRPNLRVGAEYTVFDKTREKSSHLTTLILDFSF